MGSLTPVPDQETPTGEVVPGPAPPPDPSPATPRVAASDIDLIPWDHDSAEHHARLLAQRKACGWRTDEMDEWGRLSREGSKTFYWIRDILAKHAARFPHESAPILDTAASAWGLPRQPPPPPPPPDRSPRSFVPVGHFALVRSRPEEEARIGLAGQRAAWVCHLYVSWALQSFGLGKAGMLRLEDEARAPPLEAPVIALDTMPAEYQMRPDLIEKLYIQQGNPAPRMSNQHWYERLGYETFFHEQGAYLWLNPATGQKEPIDVAYLKKVLK
ncbi:uncharacterized protein E0L32_007276 [Thyridium curvatum]|uniref:Uncharacterized protein n=1 Tax=Thyridium curvatum TaxID=1093900 RepID=A0A507AW71_9PEZI|nr:uncharacterized protein E0L32_007276 [Thyridium curvatum]TPX11973.1 hypothetical protein E0L32_007276 [Thyridium curvatum]